ncbi:DDB1- and CUL4-associated factor 5 isoform X2 [Nematostella vectensis]|uniref:DDB1- and CUL4-associated factor 5 isoform X2 n=1 Tax=Nematostella vectensis TaxID=45351 RepID=UPI0020778474|nr:DDB1- and CUL4-associated factor 5 isoform X2 [Nematostella vectensis]
MSRRWDVSPKRPVAAQSSYICHQTARELYGSSVSCSSLLAAKFASCKDLFRKDLRGHFGCVNAIEFSNKGGELVVSGGDDRRVLVWDIERSLTNTKLSPAQMKGQHRSNIFCTVFSNDNNLIYSAGNDDQAMRHDLKTGETVGVFIHDDPVYCLNIHPEDNVFLTACENGKVLMWDVRTPTGSSPSQCVARYPSSAFHAAVFNPVDPVLIATANAKKGVQLWDSRAPKKLLHQYSSITPQPCAMGVRWNKAGTMLTALRRRLPPVLYRIDRTASLAEFDHPGYNNVCTMKSHCFAGDKDQYIISGSDDFNVYVWRIPDMLANEPDTMVSVDQAFMVLSGHRSIVNQVRFNPTTHMIISAGVEKIIKVWSPWEVYGDKKSGIRPLTSSQRRELYSHDDYVDLVLSSGRPLTHEYDEGSVEEDPRMLAFFDSLIQHEERGWESDSDDSFSPEEFYLNFTHADSSGSDSGNEPPGLSIQSVRDILAGYATAPGYQEEPPADEETRAVLRRMGQLRRAMHLRNEAAEEEGDSEAQDVLRRMRRLQRAVFLRGFLREEEQEGAVAAPSESSLQYLRDINRVLIDGQGGSSSDSSTGTSSESERLARMPSNSSDLIRRARFPSTSSASSDRLGLLASPSSSSEMRAGLAPPENDAVVLRSATFRRRTFGSTRRYRRTRVADDEQDGEETSSASESSDSQSSSSSHESDVDRRRRRCKQARTHESDSTCASTNTEPNRTDPRINTGTNRMGSKLDTGPNQTDSRLLTGANGTDSRLDTGPSRTASSSKSQCSRDPLHSSSEDANSTGMLVGITQENERNSSEHSTRNSSNCEGYQSIRRIKSSATATLSHSFDSSDVCNGSGNIPACTLTQMCNSFCESEKVKESSSSTLHSCDHSNDHATSNNTRKPWDMPGYRPCNGSSGHVTQCPKTPNRGTICQEQHRTQIDDSHNEKVSNNIHCCGAGNKQQTVSSQSSEKHPGES